MQVFAGVVFLDEDERGEGLRVVLRLNQDLVTLAVRGEELGSWTPLGASVEQLSLERFRLTFGTEDVIFQPDDPVDFKYEALPILDSQEVTGWRGMLAHRRDKAEPGVRDRIRTLPDLADTPAPESPLLPTDPEEEIVEVEEDEPKGDPFEQPPVEVEEAPAPAAVAKPSLFRRRVEPHEHSFETSRIPGGLVRLVCTDCGHVSIDLTEAPVPDSTEAEDSEQAAT